MRLAVLSDIHANLDALREVLNHLDGRRVDCVISLGDNVGYGPQPEEVLALLCERGIPSIMGNHELGLVDSSYLAWFNPSSLTSLEITRGLLSSASIESMKSMKPFLVAAGCLCVHGCPPRSITTYLFELCDEDLKLLLSNLEQDICFVGHTHELVLVSSDGEGLRRERIHSELIHLAEGHKFIVNVGSVGQPRDGDNRAKYVVWDTDSRELEVHFIRYDIAGTAQRILELGFPPINAQRLW